MISLTEPAFVYCIWNIDRDTVKIGVSKSPHRRLAQLKTGCPDELILWAFYPGTRIAEQVWHESLKNCELHIAGEWFDATDDLILCGFAETALREGGSAPLVEERLQ